MKKEGLEGKCAWFINLYSCFNFGKKIVLCFLGLIIELFGEFFVLSCKLLLLCPCTLVCDFFFTKNAIMNNNKGTLMVMKGQKKVENFIYFDWEYNFRWNYKGGVTL